MNSNKLDTNWQWVASIIVFLALSRLIPHPPNFTPICAMAILAGAYIKDLRIALLIPCIAMLISDLILGLHSSLLFVYGAITVIAFATRKLLHRCSFISMAIAAVASSTIFFVVTNLGAWLSHDMYPHNANGLMQAYVAGIPFFKNTLISSLLFTLIGFLAVTAKKNLHFA